MAAAIRAGSWCQWVGPGRRCGGGLVGVVVVAQGGAAAGGWAVLSGAWGRHEGNQQQSVWLILCVPWATYSCDYLIYVALGLQ